MSKASIETIIQYVLPHIKKTYLYKQLIRANENNAGYGETAPICTWGKCGFKNEKYHFCNFKVNNGTKVVVDKVVVKNWSIKSDMITDIEENSYMMSDVKLNFRREAFTDGGDFSEVRKWRKILIDEGSNQKKIFDKN